MNRIRLGAITPSGQRLLLSLFALIAAVSADANIKNARPNILFFFADDWGRYASIYADPDLPSPSDVIQTPNIDRVGQDGITFMNAFMPVSSCNPCRSSIATSRYFWNCGSGAFLNPHGSNWEGNEDPFTQLPKFVDLLGQSGYHTSRSGKTIAFTPTRGTGNDRGLPKFKDKFPRYGLYVSEAKNAAEREERHNYVIERTRIEIQKALLSTPDDKPFFFIFGPINVHRPYVADSGKELWGINPDDLKGRIPKFLPDVNDVRRDFSDYLGEVLAVDLMLGIMMEELEKAGELDNTLIVLTGDNGIPGVPRGKTNCYDLSVQAPLLLRWPNGIKAGRTVEDFINLMDIGPTLLDLADATVPTSMDGKSFLPQITSDKSGWIDPSRDHVFVGRERHFHSARDGNLPFPMRAIRTKDFLYIHNFKPDRWPMGDPDQPSGNDAPDYAELHKRTTVVSTDLDASLTKAYMFSNRDNQSVENLLQLTMGKRPEEELYDLGKDPHQLNNLADNPEMAPTLEKLRGKVDSVMQSTKDPRLTDAFDSLPWSDSSKPVEMKRNSK